MEKNRILLPLKLSSLIIHNKNKHSLLPRILLLSLLSQWIKLLRKG